MTPERKAELRQCTVYTLDLYGRNFLNEALDALDRRDVEIEQWKALKMPPSETKVIVDQAARIAKLEAALQDIIDETTCHYSQRIGREALEKL